LRANKARTASLKNAALMLDDRQRQGLLRSKVKVHGTLGDRGLREDVVEADHVVGPACELVCGR
jgi:hypothetical protein